MARPAAPARARWRAAAFAGCYRLQRLWQGLGELRRAPRLLRRVLRDPRAAARHLRRTGDAGWIRRFFETPAEFVALRAELAAAGLPESLERRLAREFESLHGVTPRGTPWVAGALKPGQAAALYALARRLRPRRVVETGVCNGLSSAVLLEALRVNGGGHLHSIDLPEYADARSCGVEFWPGKGGAVVPPGRECGWLVPEPLRARWTLHAGRSRELLEPLLAELGAVDLFVHDSEHSLENQLFELRAAWRRLAPGGVLFVCDVTWSAALEVFRRETGRRAQGWFVDHATAVIAARPGTR